MPDAALNPRRRPAKAYAKWARLAACGCESTAHFFSLVHFCPESERYTYPLTSFTGTATNKGEVEAVLIYFTVVQRYKA